MRCNRAFTDPINNSLELIQDMKVALLRLQRSPADTAIASTLPCVTQAINDMTSFYGCKHVIAFSYVFEGVLKKVRCQFARRRGSDRTVAILLRPLFRDV